MRKIKFRAKDLFGEEFQKKWRFGYLVKDGVKGNFSIREMSGNDFPPRWTERSCSPETIGQYTGLKDKNGKEIYEGDLLRVHMFGFNGYETEHEFIGKIEWNDDCAGFGLRAVKDISASLEEDNFTPIPVFYGLHEESFEVIGNVHENPELMEVKTEV